MTDITRLLDEVQRGDSASAERLIALVYDELRTLARRQLASERAGHTLEPTALVHEAYLRLLSGPAAPSFENRAHFFASAAAAIRRLLVEHARRRARLKRGGAGERVDVDLEQALPAGPGQDGRVLAVDEALRKLASFAPERARLVELRFFAGMTVEETALACGVSASTVAREWRLARAWLAGELGEAGGS